MTEFSLLRHIDKVANNTNGEDPVKNPNNMTEQDLVDVVKGYRKIRQTDGTMKIVVVSTQK